MKTGQEQPSLYEGFSWLFSFTRLIIFWLWQNDVRHGGEECHNQMICVSFPWLFQIQLYPFDETEDEGGIWWPTPPWHLDTRLTFLMRNDTFPVAFCVYQLASGFALSSGPRPPLWTGRVNIRSGGGETSGSNPRLWLVRLPLGASRPQSLHLPSGPSSVGLLTAPYAITRSGQGQRTNEERTNKWTNKQWTNNKQVPKQA